MFKRMDMEDIENRRKRLTFRSWHRGTREMDLIMGSFAEETVNSMTMEELNFYEELLNTPDPDVYDWISGQKTPPTNLMNSVLEKLLTHTYARSQSHSRKES
jgi:antitoxin CptB